MVVALGPGKFYGSSLARPRFYADVKFNETRIDPPVPVTDPLMRWAESAHWSMGGLSFTRHRLQGRIEGKVENLRRQKDKEESAKCSAKRLKDADDESEMSKSKSPSSPPPAPRVVKRRRVQGLVDEHYEDESEERSVVRKLGDEFEKIARECGIVTRSSKRKIVNDVNKMNNNSNDDDSGCDGKKGKKRLVKVGKLRTSPRLRKNADD